jgi:Flp pilus assembly protein TadB
MNEQEQAKLKQLIRDKPKAKGVHWWDEHLNWVLFLSGAGVLPFVALFNILVDGFTPDTIWLVLFFILLPMCLLWWYLGKKAQNRWLMLLSFIPLGAWILIFLKNKNEEF